MTSAALGSPERRISRAIVAIHKDFLGRGPTRARTTIADDAVVCLLEDSMTRAEKSLAASDGPLAVRRVRRGYQDAMSGEIVAAVERLTGRRAEAFLSDHDPIRDVAIEVVKLEPRHEPAPIVNLVSA